MERKGCGINGTAKSVSMFFSKSCIPGSTPAGFPNMCELCPDKNCETSNNKYAGYAGAFKCLAEGAGEVAFIKHVTVGEEVAKNSSYGNMSDYVYLCPDNTNKVVTADSYKTCSLAQVPSHVVMTKESKENVALFQKVLVKASELCQGNVSKTNCSDFKIFESTSQHSNLLFKDSTKKLVAVGDKETWQTWLTEKYMKTLMGLEDPCVEPSRAAFLAPGLTIALFLCGSLLMLFT